jgi:hypothetical protein
MDPAGSNNAIGTPEKARRYLREMEAAGVDQVSFIQQGGRNKHEHICDSLRLFASDVMPEFKERHDENERRKNEELAPYIEAAMARKKWMKPLEDDEIPTLVALGRQIAERGYTEEEKARHRENQWDDSKGKETAAE